MSDGDPKMSQQPLSQPAIAPISLLSAQLLDRIPQAIWLANAEGNLIRLNAIGQRYMGAALGERFWRSFHSDDCVMLEAVWHDGVKRQQSWRAKSRLCMADGSYEWFEVTVEPLLTDAALPDTHGDQGGEAAWFGTLSRLASTTCDPHLLAGQEFLEALFENVSEGLVACNSAGQIVLFNRAAQEFHGLPPQPISPDRWSQYYDLYDGTGTQPLAMGDVPLMRALSGEKVRSAAMMIKPKDGKARSLVANADPIIDATGQRLGAVVLMRDVTDQKQMEAELRAAKSELEVRVAARTAELEEREMQFRTTFEQAAIGCAHVSLDGRWLRVNQKLCAIVGHTEEKLLQKTFQDITYPEDLAEDLTYLEQLLTGVVPHYSMEKRYVCGDATLVWVRITVSLRRRLSEFCNPLGEPMYFIVMVENISDRKRLEFQNAADRQVLEQAKQSLENRNRELDQFVYTVSHDLKAPLRGIANLSEWLEEDMGGQLSPDNQEQLTLIRTRVKRMDDLINGLLQYSRVGREDLETSEVNTHKLLIEIIDSLDPPPSFQIQLPDTLPTLQTQRLLLSQVFANLISNAIKHHDRDEGRIVVGWAEQDQYYQFTVTDDGPGVPPDQQERVFGIFQTLGSSEAMSNTGIGLALVKKLVEGGGGSVRLVPNVDPGHADRGSCFEFTWPKSI